MAIEKLKRYKSQGIDQIPVQLFQSGSKAVCSEVHKLADSVWNKKELCQQWKESVSVPLYQKGISKNDEQLSKHITAIADRQISNIRLSKLHLVLKNYWESSAWISDVTEQLLIIIFCMCQKMAVQCSNTVAIEGLSRHQDSINRKACI
jgi:hypothetical protein